MKSVFACTERIVRVMTRKDQHAYLACALARWENEGGSLASTGERSNSKEEREIWHKQYARRVRAIALSRPRRRRSHIQLCRPGCSIVCLGSRRPDHHVPSTSNRASRASGRAHAVAHRRSQARPERHDRPGLSDPIRHPRAEQAVRRAHFAGAARTIAPGWNSVQPSINRVRKTEAIPVAPCKIARSIPL